ncbi:MAG: thiamine phosphate synthase [Deltaproteobacteria bacterium]|nr:thiamine phosphate synthase [Deltaproteobacteria bacterium]
MIDFNLYLITDRHRTCGKPLTTVVEEALKGGIKAVQLREKGLSAKELFELAQGIRSLTWQYGARLFINDRVDIAMAVNADGVHLGQNGFSARDSKRIFPKAAIGVSTHSLNEAKKAEDEGADFITLGPIFYTSSKADYGEPLGVEVIKRVRKEINIPVFAIGGIKKDNLKDVMAAGADGAAVISAVIGTKEPEKAVKEILREII